ncbi:FxSxx-COOH system tetratricopeptide repeat protein [Frankia sp. R82]|uniref:FxSxx-COOH system tetratricopeptide repeat protein n=1 Tax=Frankia sp. R82 TaxID=2950553 RepID=UPI002044ADAF|nr:FxSxx-COOH system tetratricopeptide repeat protein [Frankia sp. R82]MCM3883229.1 FxSxx-COOH system tetratricopeptide repeat protein [Frankia sp. R82]
MTDGGGFATQPAFFVAYTDVDRRWAEWVSWVLEAAEHQVVLRAWDFGPGSRVVEELHQATQRAARTIIVASEAALVSSSTTAAWQAAWAGDDNGRACGLLVFRVEQCRLPGLLGQTVAVDLFGLDEETARRRVLAAAVGGRAKPTQAPGFPATDPAAPGASAALTDSPTFPPDLPAVWGVPPRLACFVGREDLLAQLHTQLTADGPGGGTCTVTVTALAGMGGVGKSAVAIEYAYRHAAEFDAVWWLPTENIDPVGEPLADLAAQLEMPVDAPTSHVLAMLRRRHPRHLLIADNVDEPGQVAQYRPAGSGRLLLTSRRTGFDAIGAVLDVPTFTRAESVELLTTRVTGLDPVDADRIAELLGDLALAVEQAAAYLNRVSLGPAMYLRHLEQRLGDMLGRGTVAERPQITISNLWTLSVAQLGEESPAAVELLDLCALAAPEPLPLDLVPASVQWLDDGPLKAAAEDDALAWPEAVAALTGFSLSRREHDALVTHRLVQAATRQAMSAERVAAGLATLVRVLAGYLPAEIRENPPAWPRWRQLLPHVRAVLAQADPAADPAAVRGTGGVAGLDARPGLPALAVELAPLYQRAAVYLGEHGRPVQALPLSYRAVALHEATVGPDHPDTLTARHDLAFTCRLANELEEAITLFEQTHDDQRRLLGAEHIDTLMTGNNLAYAYQEAGRLGDAVALHERTLAARVRALGADHPHTLGSRNNLALALQAAGRATAAVAQYREIVPEVERVFGPDSPAVLFARSNLGLCCLEIGRFDEAIVLLEHTLADRLRILGPDHPDCLTSRHNLAIAFEQAGRIDEAIALQEQTLRDAQRLLGPDHHDTLGTSNALAFSYESAGRLEEAIGLYEQTLEGVQRALGPEHPHTLITRNNVAAACSSAGRLAEAITMFDDILADRLRILGPDHPDCVASRHNLSATLRSAGRLPQALEGFERALHDAERILGVDHPATLNTRDLLATTYQESGRPTEAIDLFERNLGLAERVLGATNPDTQNFRARLTAVTASPAPTLPGWDGRAGQ